MRLLCCDAENNIIALITVVNAMKTSRWSKTKDHVVKSSNNAETWAQDQSHPPTVPDAIVVPKKGAWRGLKAKFTKVKPPESLETALVTPDPPSSTAIPTAQQDVGRVALARLEETLTAEIARGRAENELTRQSLAVSSTTKIQFRQLTPTPRHATAERTRAALEGALGARTDTCCARRAASKSMLRRA